jgi:asparagine synthase (glutamine-hydrolysing)
VCGIAGYVCDRGQTQRAVVDAQLRCQRHRGPDAEGAFVRGRGAVGQNRLAIIDVRGGDPPITDESGELAAVLNGEIYDFQELRQRLIDDGHRFATGCDTEVIAHIAEHADPVALASALDGMFAFAVWDARRERLVLGRDRLGKKPLYWHYGNGELVFASEIKGVLAHPRVPRELNERAIPGYLAFGYVPTPDTFYRGISSLAPGHVLVFEPGGSPRIVRYWSPPARATGGRHRRPRGRRPGELDRAATRVRSLLGDAVARRTVADVPVGAFLSGGVDSSAVVATLAQLSPEPVRTFTIGFGDERYDERRYARMVAQRYGTEHHEFVVTPDAVALIERLIWHHDQPFGDSSAIPTYLLSELTREHVTVALCGDGGDELFAGYERFVAALAAAPYGTLPGAVRGGVTRALGALAGAAPAVGGGATDSRVAAVRRRAARAQRFAANAGRGMPDAYLEWISFIDAPTRTALTGSADSDAHRLHRAVFASTAGAATLDRVLDLNLRTYLLDDLLVKADRMTMAHGLELRSPLLDPELVAFAATLAPSLQLGPRGQLKRVLRRAVEPLVPAEILARGKQGFGVPLDSWFRGELRGYLRGTLGAPDARVRSYLSGPAVDAILAEHDTGAANRGHALWTLLTLELFLRKQGW